MMKFRCSYCNKSYSRESWYDKHKQTCVKQARFEQTHRLDFMRGLALFKHWRVRQRMLRKGEEISDEKFINSHLYNSFMKLAEFTTTNWVISSMKYMDYLIDHRIAESKWMKEETLRSYHDNIRLREDPIRQTKTTCEAIQNWCKKNNMDTREFFTKITPNTALKMVINNQISPWVLFGYDRAVTELLARVNDDWLHTANEYINNTHWINKLRDAHITKQAIQVECDRLFTNS
jgi:hypothetical protein